MFWRDEFYFSYLGRVCAAGVGAAHPPHMVSLSEMFGSSSLLVPLLLSLLFYRNGSNAVERPLTFKSGEPEVILAPTY